MVACPGCGEEYQRLGQHLALSQCNYPEISDRYRQIIQGILAGDGTILEGKRCQFVVTSTTVPYLEYLQDVFPEWLSGSIYLSEEEGTVSMGPEGRKDIVSRNDCYKFSLMRHPYFNTLRREWYNGSQKRYPDGLEVTELFLKHWFVTDGSIIRRPGNARPRVHFACGNESGNPARLENLVLKSGINIHYDYDGKFRVNVDDTEKMFNMIGDPIPGFEYKWP